MAVVLGATAARADGDDWYGRRNDHHAARANRHDCGPMPRFAPRGHSFQSGRYELQATQVWVEGVAQQVWVPGQCYQQGWVQVCSQGSYQLVQQPGRYETQQQWVWVANARHDRGWRHGRRGW